MRLKIPLFHSCFNQCWIECINPFANCPVKKTFDCMHRSLFYPWNSSIRVRTRSLSSSHFTDSMFKSVGLDSINLVITVSTLVTNSFFSLSHGNLYQSKGMQFNMKVVFKIILIPVTSSEFQIMNVEKIKINKNVSKLKWIENSSDIQMN